jgi:hypothetical protein
MHDEILNELEGYLSGDPVSGSFTRHLANCPPCARDLEEMKQVSVDLQFFRIDAAEAVHPPLRFYAKVARTIEAEEKSPLWGLFAPDLQFFRKVAFASLMLLAILGSYLVSRESDFSASLDSEQAILTEHKAIPHDNLVERDHMLIKLASYEQ